MSIPSNIIDDIRERVSLVELVSERVKLRHSGKSYVGLCPFHQEKTGSFSVNEEDGLYYCFGCGKKGTAFTFVMETRGMSFPEAVQFLGRRVGIEVRDDWAKDPANNQRMDHLKELRTLARHVAMIYHQTLLDESLGKKARTYFSARGVKSESIKRFMIGYATDSWEFLVAQLKKRLSEHGETIAEDTLISKLIELGLIKERSSGQSADKDKTVSSGHFDMLRGRVIFPITRSDGLPIAFGGRIIEAREDTPKYLNTPESPLYQKRRSFFGLSQALDAVRAEKRVFLVEGYLDVVSMHEAGIVNTLACCGTALTEDHARLMSRIAKKVTVVFDGDRAGRKAAARCFELFLNTKVDLSLSMLPEGEDPDTLSRKCTPAAYRELLEERLISPLSLLINTTIAEECGREMSITGETPTLTATEQGRVAESVLSLIRRIVNPVEQENQLKVLAERLGASVEALTKLMHASARGSGGGSSYARKPTGIPNQQSSTPSPSYSPKPVSKPEAKPKPVTSKPGASERFLDTYCKQLLIAVLVRPALAQDVLDMPSVLSGCGAFEVLPESVREFITALSKEELRGIAEWKSAITSITDNHESITDEVKERARMVELLSYGHLPADELIKEAIRQCLIGGTKPERVVDDVKRVSAETLLGKEIEKIRLEEKSDVQEGKREMESIIQEKLLKRRALTKVRTSN